MRRNMRGGNRRGGGANFEGPLMTDHLQDLDLELQLLKRKRQMIEQQQQMMGGHRQRDYIYDRPQTYKEEPYNYEDQQAYNRPNTFSHNMYDESSNKSYSNNLGRKRQVVSPWENGAPPKRFSGPKGTFVKKPFGDRSGRSLDPTPEPMGRRPQLSGRPSRSPNAPQSLMSLKPKPPIGARRPAPPPRQHNFKPSRVTKPKPTAAPNKLNSYPVAERKKLVAETSNLVSDAGDDRILSIDKVPSQQMTGRLELALGQILKDLKQVYCTVQPHVASFHSPYLQRVMKQFIRERIRSVMLGKIVGNVTDILLKYRKVFPTNTDVDILQVALDAQGAIDKEKFGIKLVESDDPQEYFSINMQKLIDVTLLEMFSKLQEMYSNSGHHVSMEDDCPKEVNGPNNTSKVDETTTEIDASKLDETNPDNQTSETNETSTCKADETFTCKTDETSSACKADETNTDKDTNIVTENKDGNLDETTTENDASKVDEPITDIDGNKDDEDTFKINDDSSLDDAAKLNDTGAAKPVDEPTSDQDNKFLKKFKVFKPNSPESRQCEQFIENAVKRRMPKLLRKQIPYIIKLLNLDHMYKTASAAIIKKSVEKSGIQVRERDVGKKHLANTSHVKDGDNSLNVTTEKEVQKTHPGLPRYFVKIIARPSLPKRKQMQAFLNDFNPRTIKKHKNIHSLLFVGFTNQEDFEKILAATGTVIGRTTLEIKVSEKANDKNKSIEVQDKVEATVEATDEQKSANTSLDDLISTDLDDKINDLLSSIRKSDEENAEQTSGTTTELEMADVKIEVSENEKTNEPDKLPNLNDTDKNEEIMSQEEPKKETPQNIEESADKDKISESEKQINKIDEENIIDEGGDRVESLKNDAKESGRATPTRTSSRLANVTPSIIKTRRASRLAQNNP